MHRQQCFVGGSQAVLKGKPATYRSCHRGNEQSSWTGIIVPVAQDKSPNTPEVFVFNITDPYTENMLVMGYLAILEKNQQLNR